jgi:hypothetical protein
VFTSNNNKKGISFTTKRSRMMRRKEESATVIPKKPFARQTAQVTLFLNAPAHQAKLLGHRFSEPFGAIQCKR